MARRPDHACARPRRLRAGPAHDGRAGWSRPTLRTSSRSRRTCAAAGRRERRVLVRGLRSARFERLRSEWAEALAELAASAQHDGPEHLSAGQLAGRGISRAPGGSSATAPPSRPTRRPRTCTTLRKRCKELRYALEVFAPVIAEADRKRAVADLKGLQDVLGRFQDTEVQRHALRGFAEEMMADGTLGPGGARDGRADRPPRRRAGPRPRGVRRRFARFARPASIARLDRLGGSR